MKFDVVIGNPPYQDAVAKNNKKLWPKFFENAFNLCKNKGIVALITPNSWQTPGNKLFEYFKKYNCKYITLDARKYFPGVGSTITWYIIEKEKYSGSTKILDNNITLNFSTLDFLPNSNDKITISIINKLLSKNSMEIQKDSFCHSQRKNKVSKTKDAKFCYPVKHGTKFIYSKEKHPFSDSIKIIFNKANFKIDPIIDKGESGISENMFYKVVKNQKEAEILSNYLTSKIISFLIKHTTYAMCMSNYIVRKIPYINLSEAWTNEKLYKHFDLTQDEIKYVEETIK